MSARPLRCLLAGFVLLAAALAHADEYLPPGALSYEDSRLANGLRLIVQRVHSAPYVSARLVVKSGTDQYPCVDRELPHLVEHLLFSANRSWSEEDIDQQVNSWGGAVNAYTYAEQTEIVLEAHSRFQADAMTLLAGMIAGFDPREKDVTRESRVVEHETGVEHTPLRLWWSRQPFVQLAGEKFSVAAGLQCAPGLSEVRHLGVGDVRRAFATHYVASNMMLVLVGDLDARGIAAARTAFSALPLRTAPPPREALIRMPAGDDFTSGLLSGTASQSVPSAWGISPFRDWEGYYVLRLVESWLDDRLFHDLRSERGITYTPTANVDYVGTAIQVSLSVDTSPSDSDETMRYLRDIVDEVHRQGISADEFEDLRQSALLGMAQQFERIEDRADYLSSSTREIDQGHLFDVEAFYRDLDYARFRTLLARDWPARFVVVDNSPRVGWTLWITLLGGSLVLLAGALAALTWRRLRDARPG